MIFYIPYACFGQNIIKLDKTKISATNLDEKIKSLMEAANVQGLAVAVFNNNEAVYKKTFGHKKEIVKLYDYRM